MAIQGQGLTSTVSPNMSGFPDDLLESPQVAPEVALSLQTRSYRRRPQRPFFRRTVHVQAYLQPDEALRLRRLQKKHAVNFAEWVRLALTQMEAVRASEAHAYVRKIIPEAVALASEEAWTLQAESLMALANRPKLDLAAKKQYREDAGLALEYAAWFAEVRQDYARLRTEAPVPPAAATTR